MKRWEWGGLSDTMSQPDLIRTLNSRMRGVSREFQRQPTDHWFVVPAPNGHDDTDAIQVVLDQQNAEGFGRVYAPRGQYKIDTLRYYDGTVLKGDGFGGLNGAVGTWFNQIAGATGAMLVPDDTTVETHSPLFEDFGLTSFANQASNSGGLTLERCSNAAVHRVQVNWTNDFAFKVKAGAASAGMHNSFTKCFTQNAADVAFLLESTSTYAPDAVTMTDCTVHGNGTWFKTDGSLYRGPDALRVIGCNGIGSGSLKAFDLDGYGTRVTAGRWETVGGTITVSLRSVGHSSQVGKFIGNLWAATGGVPTWTDTGSIVSERIGEEYTGGIHRTVFLSAGLLDGLTAPATATGIAQLYVDTSDGDLKVVFGDGTVKTIVTDT